MMLQGQQVFRFETFGDEAFWGDTLQLHRAIEGSKHGGVGPGVSPKTALAVDLKVDVDTLPELLVSQLKAGKVDLDNPATTLALLKLKAVVGVMGFFNASGGLRSMGLECAFCHPPLTIRWRQEIGHPITRSSRLRRSRAIPERHLRSRRDWSASCT